MTKKPSKKTINLLIGVLILAIAIYWFTRKPGTDYSGSPSGSPSSSGSNGGSTASTPKPTASGYPKIGNNTTLKKGTKAEEVKWVQYLYNKYYARPRGLSTLSEDGVFGDKTQAAIYRSIGKNSTTYAEYYNFSKGLAGAGETVSDISGTLAGLASLLDSDPDSNSLH